MKQASSDQQQLQAFRLTSVGWTETGMISLPALRLVQVSTGLTIQGQARIAQKSDLGMVASASLGRSRDFVEQGVQISWQADYSSGTHQTVVLAMLLH
jgi:hypothetical protein